MKNTIAFILSGYDERRISAVETVELVRSCLNLSLEKVKAHDPQLARVPNDWPFPEEVDFGTPLSSFELSMRSATVLEANQIRTIGDAYAIGEFGLRRLPNFGRKSLNELGENLRQHAEERKAS